MTLTALRNYAIAFLATLGILGVINVTLVEQTVPRTETQPPPISVGGQTINFTWTDDNTDEDLIIYTDQETYSNGLSSADVYVAVVNKSKFNQEIELMGYFRDSNKAIQNVSVLTEVTKEINEPTYEQQCTDVTSTTTEGVSVPYQVCDDVFVGTSTTNSVFNQWIPLPIIDRTPEEIATETGFTRKQVENFLADHKTVPFPVSKDGVLYYKLEVVFPPNDTDNFYLEVLGDRGGYGHLDPWFDASWDYRVEIEVNPSNVSGTANHTNYPVYVDLSDLPSEFHTNVKTDGCDIRMVESDETTETAFELVTYDATGDTGELHFLADSLSYTATTTFYLYYGNSGASCYATTTTYGAQNVWTVYDAVWHLEEDPSGTAPQIQESTSNNIDMTSAGSMTGTDNVAGKLAGNAIAFDGSDDYLDPNDATTLEISSGDAYFSAWVKASDFTTTNSAFVGSYRQGAGEHAWQMAYHASGNDRFNLFTRKNGYRGRDNGTNISNDTWYYVASFWDGSADTIDMYVDGSLDNGGYNYSSGSVGDIQTNIDFPYLGARNLDDSDPSYNCACTIDEARYILNGSVSADWIATEYNNQSSPSTFYWVGAEETNGGGGGATQEPQSIIWFF